MFSRPMTLETYQDVLYFWNIAMESYMYSKKNCNWHFLYFVYIYIIFDVFVAAYELYYT